MKSLKIQNFKCFNHKEIIFPDCGLILLSGNSGCGKSTILNSIYWCLYGSNSRNLSKDKTIVEFADITRQTKQNRLSYNNLLDDQAQIEINKKYGSEKQSLCGLFLQQKNSNNILTLPASEQLELINSIAFCNDDPFILLENINNKIKKIEKHLNTNDIVLIKNNIIQLQDSLNKIQECPCVDDVSLELKTKEDLYNKYDKFLSLKKLLINIPHMNPPNVEKIKELSVIQQKYIQKQGLLSELKLIIQKYSNDINKLDGQTIIESLKIFLQEKGVRECPACKKHLILKNNKLIETKLNLPENGDNVDYSALINKIDDLSKKIRELDCTDVQNELNILLEQKEKYNIYLNDLKNQSKIQTEMDQLGISTCNITKEEILILKQKDKEYNNYINNKNIINDLNRKIELNTQKAIILESHNQKLEDEFTTLLNIKEKLLKSINMSIEDTINNINIHAAEYLNIFFDDPIIVELKNYSETKNGSIKPKINIEIILKGEERTLKDVSGGEFDRILLCFSLAVNKTLNLPILLLDECISSIEMNKKELILQELKKISQGKLVILIEHNAYDFEGIFNNIYML